MPHTRFIHMLVYDLEQNNTINLNGFAVQIDGQFLEGRATRSAAVPHLFFFPWSPALYGAGLHTLKVSYSTGVRSTTYTHSFITRPQSIRAVVAANRTLSYSAIQNAMEPGNNVGGYVLTYRIVVVMVTLSYVLSVVLVAFVVVCRQTIKRFYPYRLASDFEGRYHVYHFLFRRDIDRKFPYFMRSFAFMASDTYVSRFFIGALLWETLGFWAVGKFPREFGLQSLWGVLFVPATRLGNYSLWLDLYLWHVIFLVLFYIPLMLYYCAFMIPHGMTPEATPLSRALRMICHCIAFIYFVGIFLFVKVLAFWMSFDKATLLLSPVWFWIPFINAVLMVRELVFEHHYNRKGLKIREEVMEKAAAQAAGEVDDSEIEVSMVKAPSPATPTTPTTPATPATPEKREPDLSSPLTTTPESTE